VVAAVGVSSTGRQRREWHRRAGCGGAAAVWQQQCGRGGSVAAAAVWRRRPGGIGVTVSAWRCGSSGRAAVVWHHQRTSSRGGPMWRERCGSSGVAAAADGSSWAEPAGDDQSGGRACVRAGAQTWLAHLRGRQRGRDGRASGRWRAFFEFTASLSMRVLTTTPSPLPHRWAASSYGTACESYSRRHVHVPG
jgi:hypothetical protein